MFCGYLIWKGRLHPAATFFAGLSGSACGISLSYVLGRTYGHKMAYRYGKYIGLTSERLGRVHRWFYRMGSWLLAVGYFIPGVRHCSALVAGMSELHYPTFALFAYSGAALWVTCFLSLGFLVGENWQHAAALVDRTHCSSALLRSSYLSFGGSPGGNPKSGDEMPSKNEP